MNVDRKLDYSYDLLYDIKNTEQLQQEVEYLTHRLSGIAALCRQDNHSIDDYIRSVLQLEDKP